MLSALTLMMLVACNEKDPQDTATAGDGGAGDGGAEDGGGGGGNECSPQIPASAEVVNTVVSNSASGSFEICDGGQLAANAGSIEVYVNANASAVINGGDAMVWVDDGGSVVINGGAATVWSAPTAVVTVNAGSIDAQVECAAVEFTGSGC